MARHNPFPPIRMLWLGSDVEFLYFDREQQVPLDLSELVAHDREHRLECFIGTDGHAMNAEIRPEPCRNIYLHLARIADGVHQVYHRLREWGNRHPMYANVVLIASPEFQHEVFGGHIHLSLFVKDPALASMVAQKVVPYNGTLPMTVWHGLREKRPITVHDLEALAIYMKNDGGFTMDRMLGKIRYLGEAFEDALFHPYNRARKNPNVVREPVFRMANVPAGDEKRISEQALKRGEAYLRFEWRQPSTWLRDPAIAYCYFALVKFAALNAQYIPSPYKERDGELPRTTFARRLNTLLDKGARLTPDLTAFPYRSLEVLDTPYGPHPWIVDYNAWNRYRAT